MGRQKNTRKPTGPKRPPLTHFLCLPLVTSTSRPQLEESLKQFKDDVAPTDQPAQDQTRLPTSNGEDTIVPSIHPKAIRPVGSLHCTLGVMSLDKEQLADAVDFLHGLDVATIVNEVEQPGTHNPPEDDSGKQAAVEGPVLLSNGSSSFQPVNVNLKGLVSMHAPQKTSILYTAPKDDTERLYPMCLHIQRLFKTKGFLIEDNRDLKLHATVVNTIYAKGRKRPPRHTSSSSTVQPEDGPSQGHGPYANAPLKIDATTVLEKYQGHVWAENVAINRIAICEMGAKKITDTDGNVVDEEYTEVASLALPS
jgi:activating signal cointegrator complex subunit 1